MRIKFDKEGRIVFVSRYSVCMNHIEYVFPKGFKSDGASIPWIFQLFFNPYEGDTLDAALVHDALYSAQGRFKIGKDEYRLTRASTDRTMRLIMRLQHVPKWKYCTFWLAVRLGGWFVWRFKPLSTKRLSVVIK